MRIAVIGINHKVAKVAIREKMALALLNRFSSHTLPTHLRESCVVLSTCNRAELYFASENLADTHQHILSILREEIDVDFEQKCYSFFGIDCLQHLARVAAGLDSAIIAETEIQGQVRNAYEVASSTYSLCSELHFLFQKALKISKEVRTKFLIHRDIPDLEHAVAAKVYEYFKKTVPSILFVGTSEINVKTATFLQNKGLATVTFTNRSELPLSHISKRLSCSTLAWHQFPHSWAEYECIVCATKSPSYLLTEKIYQKSPRRRLLIDLSIPRNIDPDIKADIMNIDMLQNFAAEKRTGFHASVHTAETLIRDVSERLTASRIQIRNTRGALR